MYMRTIPTLIAAITLQGAFAQSSTLELIRNGGFEQLDKSVNTYDQFNNVSGWRNATLGLSEVFDKKANAKTVGIPNNDYGSMEPFEGDRYAGFFGWKDDVRRNFGAADPEEVFKPGWNAYSEYLQSELVAPLLENEYYELVFHVALSGNSDRTILGIGAHFSDSPLYYNHRRFMEEIPDVYLAEMITEKGKWTEVRGTFKADGKERFINIGVFPYVGLESKMLVEGVDNRYAYFYIDGVSLKMVPRPE
jgi:hypothetical protein